MYLNILYSIVIFCHICSIQAVDHSQRVDKDVTDLHRIFFVKEVWKNCLMENSLCNTMFSSIYYTKKNVKSFPDVRLDDKNVNAHEKLIKMPQSTNLNTNLLQDSTDTAKNLENPLNLIEMTILNRLFASHSEDYTSLSFIFKLYQDNIKAHLIQNNEHSSAHVDELNESSKDITISQKMWNKTLYMILSPVLLTNNKDGDGINDQQAILFKDVIDDLSKLIHKLHMSLITAELSIMVLNNPEISIKRMSKHSRDNSPSINKKMDISTNKMESNLLETDNTLYYSLNMCSKNKYMTFDPISKEYRCMCYSDKNCEVDIESVCENESYHPLLIICFTVFICLFIVRILTTMNQII